MQEKFRVDYNLDVTRKVEQIGEMHPRVVKWMFDELDKTIVEESVTERQIVRDFDRRVLDPNYAVMLQLRKKRRKDCVWPKLILVLTICFPIAR